MPVTQRKGEKLPNDYKKGNRTKSRRDPTVIQSLSKQYSEDIDKYKRFAEARRNRVVYKQERTGEFYNNILTYLKDREENERPFTVAGLQLAMGVPPEAYNRMCSGEYDYLFEQYIDINNIDIDTVNSYIDGMPVINQDFTDLQDLEELKGAVMLIPYSFMMQKALLKIQEQTEERLYLKGRVGDIFALKAQHGWKEDEAPHTVNQTLVIASEEQARKAIESLEANRVKLP